MAEPQLPTVRYALLGSAAAGGQPRMLASRQPEVACYAASTVKLALAAAVLRACDEDLLQPQQRVRCFSRFASRVPGAPPYTVDADDADPDFPTDGATLTVRELLWRTICVSSNQATNVLLETLGCVREADRSGAASCRSPHPRPDGLLHPANAEAVARHRYVLAGLAAVSEVLQQFALAGQPQASGIEFSRGICDGAARQAGYTHRADPLQLAQLMWAALTGPVLSRESRALLWEQLREQRYGFALGGQQVARPWGSKSGWDVGVLHDVVAVGEPGSAEFWVLAVQTEGMQAGEGQAAVRAVAAALLPTRALRA